MDAIADALPVALPLVIVWSVALGAALKTHRDDVRDGELQPIPVPSRNEQHR